MVLSIDFDIRSSGPLYHKRTSLSVVTSSLSTDFTSLSRTVFRVLSRKPLMKQGCIFHDQSVSHRHLPPLSFLDLLEYLLQFLHQNSLVHSELESYGMTAFLKPHGTVFSVILPFTISLPSSTFIDTEWDSFLIVFLIR